MLNQHVIPIINENDTISVTELMFTDNDELSGLIATMMNADTLIILSNVQGILPVIRPIRKVNCSHPSNPESNIWILIFKAANHLSAEVEC